MQAPVTENALGQLIHRCRWMSISIPNFNQRIHKLNKVLEGASKSDGKRRKSTMKHIKLSQMYWGIEHDAAMLGLQNNLRNAVKLSFQKEDHVKGVFTNAPKRVRPAS